MAIRVVPGAADNICDFADGFVVHVTEVADVEAAAGALALARADILALAPVAGPAPERPAAGRWGPGTWSPHLSSPGRSSPGGSARGAPEQTSPLPLGPVERPTISKAVLAPGGPMLRVVRLGADDDHLRLVPALVAARLERAGVSDARIDSPPPGGPLDQLDSCPSAVVLRLFPQPAGEAGTVPASWIDIACEWALGDLAPSQTVPLRLLAVEFDVKVADAPAIVHQAGLAGAWCDVVNGSLAERVHTASITFGRAPHVALAAGGPACDDDAILARFELLCEVARDLAADVSYACVDLEPTFEGIGLGLGGGGWRRHGGASPNLVAGELSDVLVPDVFPFQVLGKGHLVRLAPQAPDRDAPPVGEPIADGRVEVLIGDPADWLPTYDGREDVQAEGFELLAPLLATDEQVAELLDARPGRQVADDDGPAGGRAGSTGTPDLDDIVLETLPHARRGLRLTFLELVSWLAHEHHSDAPESVSPVLATYSRWFASALRSERRQELKSRARQLIGTAGPDPEAAPPSSHGLTSTDSERVWLTTDWLIRVQAGAWLRLAGLVEAAGRLQDLGPTRDHLELVRAVDVLGSAITIAGRRIDLTAAIAGSERPSDAALVEQAAWEAWESVSETAGWVAASETAGVGVPAELAYMTDLRVIECARDPRAREELDTARRSIGDSAWATALHAVADEAWLTGWAAAHAAIDGLAMVPLHTALERSRRAAANRGGADDDAREVALEAAETAAKEHLTRAALGSTTWRSHEHPWDEAWQAAAAEPSGLWASVQAMARAAVDEAPWEAGMAAARAAVDEVLQDAPNLVARAVGAAVAKEAAGVAARGVALRAAAVARAQGGDVAAVTEAAIAALAPTAEELQDAAFALLDALISVPTPSTPPTRQPPEPEALSHGFRNE